MKSLHVVLICRKSGYAIMYAGSAVKVELAVL